MTGGRFGWRVSGRVDGRVDSSEKQIYCLFIYEVYYIYIYFGGILEV